VLRLHSHIWVSAYIKKVNLHGASAVLLRRGEATAGAIYVKVSRLNQTAELFSPAPLFMIEEQTNKINGSNEIDRCWLSEFGKAPQPELEYDADIWVIEVEDPEGRHFLDEQLIDTNLD
jgi:hypothetical protein